MKDVEMKNLLTKINDEFTQIFANESEAVLLDVELSCHSPTCKCMRSGSDVPIVGD